MPRIKLSQVVMVRVIFSLALILLITMSYLLLKRINRQVTFSEQANRTNLVRLYLEQMLSEVQSMEAGQRGFLLTKDSVFLHTFRQSQQGINADLVILDSLAVSNYSQKQVDTLRDLVGRRMLLIDSVLKVYGNPIKEIEIRETLEPGRKVMDSIRNHTNRFMQTEMQLLNEEQKLKERYTFVTPRFALLFILFAFIVFTFSYMILNKQLRISKAYLQQKQKALKDLEEMNVIYRNAEEVASLGSWQWNLQTNMFKCSDNLFRIYGAEPRQEDISFNRFISFVVPEDRDRLIQNIKHAFDEKITLVVTYRIIRSDNTIRHMRAIGKMRAESSNQIMLGATQDVTEVTEAVEKLQSSEAFNRSITELVPDVIYIYDLESKTLLYLNKDIQLTLGFTYEELTTPGFDFLQLFHPDDLTQTMTRLETFRKLEEGEVVTSEYRIKHKNGEWKSIYARATCFKRNENGRAAQIIGVASDITEMKKNTEKLSKLNEELAAKNRELQQSNSELSSFNFIASHDLQEPLRKIQTFVSFLEESETNLSETGRFYLQRMQNAAARIRALIKDILSYAHSTHMEKEWGDVDLNIVLDNVRQSLNQIITAKKASVQASQLPVVQGNAFQLQQLFEHILNNAFKYHKPGQAPLISITAETVTNEHGMVAELEAGRTYHKISFADKGIGFEQEYAGKIFGLFQRLHTRGEDVGSGIGLAICKKIVQYHGGAIEARSEPDEGSVFDVYLPA